MVFARIARKNYMGARLLVLAKFLQLLARSHSHLNVLDCAKFRSFCFVVSFLCINDKSVMTWWRQIGWNILTFGLSLSNCCGGAVCIIGKTHEALQQVFRLLFYSLSYFIGAAGFLLSKAWFPYRCICRVCRTKKIHRTDRIHSILYNKLYLSFLLYWAFVREVSIKLYLSYEFFSYDRHDRYDRYNDMETRLKVLAARKKNLSNARARKN